MEIVGAIVVAIILTLLFFYGLSARGPWGSLWSFFLVILLTVWAASFWVEPVGPAYGGIAWVPLFFIGLIFALLLAAIPTTDQKGRSRLRSDVIGDVPEEEEREAKTAIAISTMFWVFIGLLLLAVAAGYTM